MTCKSCEERRRKIKAWMDAANESYRRLIDRDNKTVKTTKRKSRKTDRPVELTVESDSTTNDGASGQG